MWSWCLSCSGGSKSSIHQSFLYPPGPCYSQYWGVTVTIRIFTAESFGFIDVTVAWNYGFHGISAYFMCFLRVSLYWTYLISRDDFLPRELNQSGHWTNLTTMILVYTFVKPHEIQKNATVTNTFTGGMEMQNSFFFWSLSLLNGGINFDSLWTHLEADIAFVFAFASI